MRSIKSPCRTALTLLELIVVIAVINLLIALALPAIQEARESGRRIHCVANLRQLGLAQQQYHDVHGMFTPGSESCSLALHPGNNGTDADGNMICVDGIGPQDPALNGWISLKGSRLVRLLPFLDQSTFYDQLDFRGSIDGQIAETPQLRSARITIFQCPSESEFSASKMHANYGVSLGPLDLVYPCDKFAPQRGAPWVSPTNSVQYPMAGNTYFGETLYVGNRFFVRQDSRGASGVHSPAWWTARSQDITDGTSNTIQMLEMLPACSIESVGNWWDIMSGKVSTLLPVNFPTCPGQKGNGYDGYGNGIDPCTGKLGRSGAKSNHRNGAQVVFCDGAVRFIPNTVNYEVYQRLGARRDGLPTP